MPTIDFFILTIFVIINFLILFKIKTRTTLVIAMISSHLIIVLFFNIRLNSFSNFKEIVLALSIYSMVILFLISNHNPLIVELKEDQNFFINYKIISFYILISIIIMAFSASVLLVVSNVPEIGKIILDKKIIRQKELEVNPMILPSHPVHIAVKKFYLGKKFNDSYCDSTSLALEKNEIRKLKLKDQLSKNFIFKRSSDIILIIVASISALLILSNKRSFVK